MTKAIKWEVYLECDNYGSWLKYSSEDGHFHVFPTIGADDNIMIWTLMVYRYMEDDEPKIPSGVHYYDFNTAAEAMIAAQEMYVG